MDIKFIGTHNAETTNFAHTCFLLGDNILFDCGSAASHMDLEQQQSLRGIFITHGHYDHIKDIPAIGMNLFLDGGKHLPLPIMTLPETLECIKKNLSNPDIYSDFFEKGIFLPRKVTVGESFDFAGYHITPIESIHKIPCVGYVVEKDNTSFYYTGDTAVGFAENLIACKKTCNILITECTLQNSMQGTTAHLTPRELGQELKRIKEYQSFYPSVFAVHRSAKMEKTIISELETVAADLSTEIFCPQEGTKISF